MGEEVCIVEGMRVKSLFTGQIFALRPGKARTFLEVVVEKQIQNKEFRNEIVMLGMV